MPHPDRTPTLAEYTLTLEDVMTIFRALTPENRLLFKARAEELVASLSPTETHHNKGSF